jgi:hypothetical protein
MHRRGYVFDARHWKTNFDVSANELLRKLAVRPLGSSIAEGIRSSIVRKVPTWERELVEIGQRNAALVGSITEVTGASVFVDASKDPARVGFLRTYSQLEPRIIHLVRDSPAFVNSYMKKHRGPRSLNTAIGWWSETALRMERLRKVTPAERWLLVRYEDLCENPGAQASRILEFLGIHDAKPFLEFRERSHHIIGNKMRLGNSSKIKLDTSWREDLSKSQFSLILKRTQAQRRLLGYDHLGDI